MEEALPALEEAKKALSAVKKEDITEIKALASPPDAVQRVCTITYLVYQSPAVKLGQDDWGQVKTVLLGDTKMLDNLKTYDVEKLKGDAVKKARQKMQELEKK